MNNDKNGNNNGWGGAREGAGNKASPHPKKLLSLRASDEEWADLLARLPKSGRAKYKLIKRMIGLAESEPTE